MLIRALVTSARQLAAIAAGARHPVSVYVDQYGQSRVDLGLSGASAVLAAGGTLGEAHPDACPPWQAVSVEIDGVTVVAAARLEVPR